MPKFLKIFKKKSKAPKLEPSEKNVEPTKPTTSPSPSPSVIDPEQTVDIVGRSTNAAFQEAWRQHWKDLSKDEQVAWSRQGPRSALQMEKTVEEMNQMHRERSVARKIADRALVFLRAVESLMAGATIAAQAYPEVGSIILGVIRIVINAAVNYFEYYEKLTEMMEYLSNFLNTLDIFDGVKTNEPRLHETLVSIYTNVLSFCRYARRAYLGQGFTVFAQVQWVTFEEQFRQIKLNLKHQTGNLNLVTTAITMKSALALEQNMIKKVSLDAQNERREVLEWVSQANITEIHKAMSAKRYKTTGSWLLNAKSFEDWIKDADKSTLWLYGPAGTGKSILASVVINHLIECSKSTKNPVVYSYFKGEDGKMQDMPIQMMSSLVKQLCWKIKDLSDALMETYYDFRMNARRPSFDDLEDLFLQCAKNFERVFIVLDGLDECDEKYRKQILQFVCEISIQSRNVKAFVTGRRELDILRTFRRYEIQSMSSQCPDAQKDVEKFVRHRVETELKHIKQEIQEDVTKTLIDNSKGMYLWVDLQLNDLAQVPEPDIRTQLKLLPTELEDTYVSMFRRMKALPQTTKSLIQTCFLWALNSKEPITAPTFIDAVSLKLKMSSEQTGLYKVEDLREITFGLLVIGQWWLSNVRPTHFSIQEFYMHPKQNHPPDLYEVLPDANTADARMAVMCLQHLMLDEEPPDMFDSCLLYCARNFDGYIKNLATIPDDLWNILDRICLKEPQLMKRILAYRIPTQTYDAPNFACLGNPRSLDPVMFMRSTGLDEVPAIWSRYKDAGGTPRDYPMDYFFLAALLNFDEIVTNLISRGININKATHDRWTALHVAIMSTSAIEKKPVVSTIEILLDAGADWNFDARHVPSGEPRENYNTPLNDALAHQAYLAVPVIVRHKSFNFATYMKTIPLECAEYIKHLVMHGADMNQRDEYGDTALQIARDDGREDCVKVLEELGAVE